MDLRLDPLRVSDAAEMAVVLADPDAPAAVVLRDVARRLASRARGLAGRPLGLSPVGR